MPLDQDAIAAQLELLATHRRTLAALLQQQAQYGAGHIPAHIINGIIEARNEIRHIKTKLTENDIPVEDKPNDDASSQADSAQFYLHQPDQRAAEARNIEEQRTQEATLNTYLDQMTQLLLDKGLRTSHPKDGVHNVAQAKTLMVLRVLDGAIKATVLQFLYEAGLIGGITKGENGKPQLINAVVRLEGANLRGVNLQEVNLRGVNLQGANLQEAELQEANLQEAELKGAELKGANLQDAELQKANLQKANLQGAKLQGADLEGANLRWADLQRAKLEGANLQGANLQEVNLRWANLQEAYLQGVDLSGADLTGCKVTCKQLAKAKSLADATLPLLCRLYLLWH